jgi:hypothetical protein
MFYDTAAGGQRNFILQIVIDTDALNDAGALEDAVDDADTIADAPR